MRIAIDARMYGTKQRGIGRYLIKLIENLEQVDSKNEYTIFLRSQNYEEFQPRNPNFKKALWDVPWYGWREQLQCRMQNAECRIDLTHFPHWNVPLFFNKPFVVTIHDLQLFSSSRVRESTTRGWLAYAIKLLGFKIIFHHAVLAARAIIVPSNYVKNQLLAKYPRLKEKIFIIYEAPTIDHKNIKTLKHENKLLPENFVLYIGAAYPHKNLERLLKAWNIIHEKLPDYKLVLVGREDFFWKKLKKSLHSVIASEAGSHAEGRSASGGQSHATAKRSPRSPNGSLAMTKKDGIIFYGSATDDELAALYENASLLVQPSLEEGFSLTPLEALSFGCPVVVSDISTHREILQNAAHYFNPLSPQKIADIILCLLANEKLRQDTIKRGADILKNYSWHAHANDTLHLYANVLS